MAATSAVLLFWEWLVRTNDLVELWNAQPSFIISQAVFLLAGFVTLIHAFIKGGRWPYFWLCTITHGLLVGNFRHILGPSYDVFWHAQTPLVLLGSRLPLHIIFLYPAFIYHAAYAVSRLNLPKYAEPCAVGLVTVLIDIPYDIVAVKFVHWTWHDTDPNVYDRHYWVPWTSYYFHMTFAASLVFFFNECRKWITPKTKPSKIKPRWQSEGKLIELKSLIISTVLGMPGGILMFIPIYLPLHDTLKIHTEVAFFVIFAIFGSVVLHGLLSEREKIKERLSPIDFVLMAQLASHYFIYWVFVVFFNPEREWSTGFHEPVGPCNEMTTLVSALGQTLSKRKHFCVEDYDEGYFDFHCAGGEQPLPGTTWYTICGTPFENRSEYIVILSTIMLFAASVFYGMYFRTFQIGVVRKTKKK